jgi:hypothetical protein
MKLQILMLTSGYVAVLFVDSAPSVPQLAGVVANSAAANGMEVDGQRQQQQGRKLYFGSQELGYKRPDMEVRQEPRRCTAARVVWMHPVAMYQP